MNKTILHWIPVVVLFWLGGLIQGLAIATSQFDWVFLASLLSTACFALAGILAPRHGGTNERNEK